MYYARNTMSKMLEKMHQKLIMYDIIYIYYRNKIMLLKSY
jgi:hypothetical protein